HLLVVLRDGAAEGLLVVLREQRAHAPGDVGRARLHFTGIEERPDALRPKAVLRAVPAEPAMKAHIEHRGRVAVDELQAEGARPRVLEMAEGRVAGGAQDRAGAREPRLEKELLAERDGFGLA